MSCWKIVLKTDCELLNNEWSAVNMSKTRKIQNKLDTAFLPVEMTTVSLIRLQLDFYVLLFVREIKTQLLCTDNSQPSLAQDTFY